MAGWSAAFNVRSTFVARDSADIASAADIYLDSEVWDSLKTFLWRGWTVGRSPSTFTHFPPTNLLYRQQALIPVPFEAMRAGSGLVWDEIHI